MGLTEPSPYEKITKEKKHHPAFTISQLLTIHEITMEKLSQSKLYPDRRTELEDIMFICGNIIKRNRK
jgi:hypothetical protein